MIKVMHKAGAAVVALVAAVPTFGQTTTADPRGGSSLAASAPAAASAPPTGASASPQNDDIVVTAQRRGENVQNVPLSVTVLSAGSLAQKGVTNTQDLTLAVPGLNFARSTSAAQPTIRGIGSRSASTGNEGNVAVYVDGVYQPQPFGNLFELTDVDQIEVLKGPQGTLYGRNATGGAIIITTLQPSFTPRADVSLSYGSFAYKKGTVFATGPLAGDTLAASLALSGSEDHGYVDNIYLGHKVGGSYNVSGHGKILWRPTPDLEIWAGLSILRSNNPDNYVGKPFNGNTAARTAANPTGIPLDVIIPPGDFQTSGTINPKVTLHNTQADLHGKYDLGFATLTGLFGYKSTAGVQYSDSDDTPINLLAISLRSVSKTYNAELQLTSNNPGPLSWILGTTGFWDRTQTDPQVILPASRSNYGVRTKAGAVFGEATYQPVTNLFFTGGLRFSSEQKRAFNDQLGPLTDVFASGGAVISHAEGKHSWNSLTPRAVVRWEFANHSNIYASFTKGFKSGAFDASSAAGAEAAVNPEHVNAYEVGVKADVTPKIRFNASGFRYDYTNLQVVVINASSGVSFSQLQNAANARIYGAEAEVTWRPLSKFTLSANMAYLDTKFTSFPNASVQEIKYVNGLPAGNVTVSEDVTGKQLIRAPRWTGTVSLDYHTPLLGGTIDFNGSVFTSDKYYTDVNNVRFQPSYTVVNGSITWRAPDNRFFVSVSGQNLTNERYITQIYTSGLGDLATYQRPARVVGTIGFSI